MYHFYHTMTRFRRLFTVTHPCKPTHNIRPTWYKSQDGWPLMQLAVMRHRIHLVYNKQVGCYACQFDLQLTIYSSGLPTSFRYLLLQNSPLRFFIIISSLPQQPIMAPLTPQRSKSGTESSRMMGVSSITPPSLTHLQIKHNLVHRYSANAATENMTRDTY